jgi:2-keto-4-pentenoate hydratase/2-oxohepta-3-ene-1,7-dioic acid hydratase in catechol pathway
MKLATFTLNGGAPVIGSVDTQKDTVLDLQAAHRTLFGGANPAFNSMLDLIEAGEPALDLARKVVEQSKGQGAHALSAVKLLAPVPLPPQIRDFNCFEQHATGAVAGMQVLRARMEGKPEPDRAKIAQPMAPVYRERPIFYISNRFSVVGPDADIEWPAYCDYLDYELEIGMYIGRRGKNIAAKDAGRHIFGYSIFNDFSARDQQMKEMEGRMGPTKGKSFDSGNAMGPWIVTRDEIPDVAALNVSVSVNGEVRGKNTSANILHSFEEMIAYVSQSETVHPGEVYGSGTIGGCCGLEISRFLEDRDVVEIDIEKIGKLRNRVVKRNA